MGILSDIVKYTLILVIGYVVYLYFKPVPIPKLDPNPWWRSGEKGLDDTQIRPFTFDVSNQELADLNARLERPLVLTPPLEKSFAYGVNTESFQEIITYWRTKYNFRERQKRINSLPHFKTQIEGLDVHFVRVKPQNVPAGKEVRTILLIHGWPGSVAEFYNIIPILTAPRTDQNFVFEVIAPSIPGFGFSEAPGKPGFGLMHIAQVFHKLMERLNIEKYYVQGGDWGSFITQISATLYPENVLGAHTNLMVTTNRWALLRIFAGACLPSGWVMDPSIEPQFYPLTKFIGNFLHEAGYILLQATKPDTVGIALNDSPVGLAAWILEKFSAWTNPLNPSKPDGGLLKGFPIHIDDMLDDISIYWFSHSITSSMRFLLDIPVYAMSLMDEVVSQVPFGFSRFPSDMVNFPPETILPKFPNFVFCKKHEKCGHFAALECPDLLADDIFSFVKIVESLNQTGKSEL